ncbi:hypothetical protein [Methylobacterium brachythecii]|uniref:Uncharacterized protein n=1 Tax=Methylobacterium brachythecii TaxID=1176177 RepID=A0A7W6ALF6_9HYPH|nr:hypothetical protein [Methylobacterium brachythecii]MBB3903375.1 hypothetical protein [Methylobacterium brachythecii]GLS45456.1 hypothetical protein GCM10007884_34460 [Methylobacterium brachythecii]
MPRILPSAIAASLAVTLAGGAFAQGRPKAAPPPPPPQAAPPNTGLFPCRSEKEICFVGGVKDGKLVLLFTNDPKGEDALGKPLGATTGDAGAPLDLSANEGKVVMLTGSYDPKAGVTKAEVVDVASPLVAFAIKANAGSGGDDGPPGPPPPPGKKR